MSAENKAILRCTGLTKEYLVGRSVKRAISDVSLSIPAGEFWAVRGPSGSGKTTLLALLGGMIVPTRGEVQLCGKSLTHLRDHHRAAARRDLVGMVFQDFALVAGMTLMENVFLPLVPLGGARRQHEKKVKGLLERFGVEALAGVKVERLSGGERQRAAIIRAVLLDPPVLLLDEPTAYVDAENVSFLMELLTSLRDEGRTIVVATHDARLAEGAPLDGALELVDGVIRR
jgi:putative ABC transport system ATP-binding protein